MKFPGWPFCALLFCSTMAYPQDQQDTVKNLKEVIIQAYSLEKPLSEVSASVGYIDTGDLTRFSEINILPAVNTIPGVRMEERSPGSYRFSIRGSLLRSPFGVRNVKVYWNGLPLTDGGGNTYLNLLDVNAIGSMEVIKGPAGSLYGAGTGGVVLLSSPFVKKFKFDFSQTFGSFGLSRSQISTDFAGKNHNLSVHWAHQKYDGYREQSSLRRNFLDINFKFKLGEKDYLSTVVFQSYLGYDTPGGLTKIQYDTLPTQARPASGFTRGAVEQHANVFNITRFIGLNYDHEWNQKWTSKLGLFGSKSDFDNPTIRNVEERDEQNLGLRLENKLVIEKNDRQSTITFGAEYQNFQSPIDVFDNNQGLKGAVQTKDDLGSDLFFVFGQADFEFTFDFYVTIGASLNMLNYDYVHLEPLPGIRQQRQFSPILCPRIAMLKKVNESFSFYGNVSRGYSPPSLAEVRPSTNNYNGSLNSEEGVNAELGARGTIRNITFDVSTYLFSLNETIVIQRTPDGADYFINAGKTSQQGLEALVSWNPIQEANGFISYFKIWNSYTYNHYRFKEYVPDGNDYSDNKLTGVPPTVNTTGIDVKFKRLVYFNITANYVDHIPLNDANTDYASEYFLLGGRMGFKIPIKSENVLEFFGGVDNALDKKYSLGNDLNAIGGRYYNAAPGINFYGGVKITVL